MLTDNNKKKFDLEERTFKFAVDCRSFIKLIPKTLANTEDIKQLIRSSGSVAANYIEANEALSRKDYFHRVRICRKEAKESLLWLKLVETSKSGEDNKLRVVLIAEATELMRIFGSILEKSK